MTLSIRVRCTGADTVDISKLTHFQRDLKDLSLENFEKLKKEIIAEGFKNPFLVWKDDAGKLNLIDGHQRLRVLNAMRSEGYKIPKLPITYTQNDTKKHAAKHVLATSANYGTITNDGAYEFGEEYHLTLDDICSYPIDGLDADKFRMEFDDVLPDEKDDDKKTEKEKCPTCGK